MRKRRDYLWVLAAVLALTWPMGLALADGDDNGDVPPQVTPADGPSDTDTGSGGDDDSSDGGGNPHQAGPVAGCQAELLHL